MHRYFSENEFGLRFASKGQNPGRGEDSWFRRWLRLMHDSLTWGKMPFIADYHPHKWRFSAT